MSTDLNAQSKRSHGGLVNDGWSVPTVRPPATTTPPPPGFQSSQSVSGDDGLALTRAESIRSLGALSAPVPPGFNSGQGDRSRLGGSAVDWSSQDRRAGMRAAVQSTGGGSEDNGLAKAMRSDARTNSFSNLAAALGKGLAESMEDSTRADLKASALLTDSFLFDPPQNDLTMMRHSRHTQARMLGTSPSKDAFGPSHTAPEAGSLFSPISGGQKMFPKKSGGNHSSSSLLGDSFRHRSNNEITSGLTAAFSRDASEDRMPTFRGGYHPPPKLTSVSSTPEFNGSQARSRVSNSKDLGVTVMEPSESSARSPFPSPYGGLSDRKHDSNYSLERGMQNLWSGRGDAMRSDQSVGNASTGSASVGASVDQSNPEADLRPFMWDGRHNEPSRSLVILRASSLPANEVRAICEAFGVVESFRPDFSDRGIFFVSYFDMRSAQYAAAELQMQLQRLDDRGDSRLYVQFCVPLNSSSQFDESLVVLTDVPNEVDIEGLASMLSSYGPVRSLKSLGGSYGGSSFVVEYHDIQDAKQALLELESTQPWGPNVTVEVGARNPSDRKRGRELLSMISRWRHGHSSRRRNDRGMSDVGHHGGHRDRGMGNRPGSPNSHGSYHAGSHASRHDSRYDRSVASSRSETTKLILGPDGRYSYVVVNHSGYPPSYGGHSHIPHEPLHQRVHHGAHGTYVTHIHPSPHHNPHQYWSPPHASHHHNFPPGATVVSTSSYTDNQHGRQYPSGSQSVPYFGHGAGDAGSIGSNSHMMNMPQSTTGGDDKDNRHLMLDLDAVENGRDTRTSLMVRNIPNKYTQQMLLSEFTENGHGPGVIDFFYLPIDFKNRCNRGYAFINFVDNRDILPFHRRYYGKHWRTFNSDKICDITYARIQGKSAMLKRFENSALMEKEDEYKPLVFVSHGPDKGTRLPFPDPSNKP